MGIPTQINDNAQSECFNPIVIVQVIIGWDRDTTIYSSNEKLLKFNDLKVRFTDHSEQNQWAVACKQRYKNLDLYQFLCYYQEIKKHKILKVC